MGFGGHGPIEPCLQQEHLVFTLRGLCQQTLRGQHEKTHPSHTLLLFEIG